ncbi:MAG: NADH:flavin oxidoreductase/NADH oxidase family protein [Gammaproteobacteria bacterium]
MIDKPLTLPCGAVLKNRLIKSAMSEALGDKHNNPRGALTKLFSHWGGGGAALLITGNTPVDRNHLEHAANVVLDGQTDLAKMKKLAAAAKKGGAKILVQLAHAGRQTPLAVNPRPLSVSALPLALAGYGKPRAASDKQLRDIINRFARAAMLAMDAGFDGVEVHAAHGYLLSSSLSPKINTRTDGWGGTTKKRARLACEVVRAVRAQTGAGFIVAVKLNASDFQKGGLDGRESAAAAAMLQDAGADFLEVSGGNFEAPVSYRHDKQKAGREAYFLASARDIKAAVDIPVMVTGGFRTAKAMGDALKSNKADLIGMGRPFIIDPAFAAKLLGGAIASAPAPENTFAPAASMPRGAVLNWFCYQLTLAAKNGAADLALPVISGHRRYLATMRRAENRRQT